MMKFPTLNLTQYQKEPIHTPGLIQPHGILFVLSDQLDVLQVSHNTWKVFRRHPEDLLGQNLNQLLDETQIETLKECLFHHNLQPVNPLKISIKSEGETLYFDGIVQRSPQGLFILELEPALSPKTLGFLSFYNLVEASASKIQNAPDFQNLCQLLVKEVRNITGFDRVMLYRFNKQGHGTVLAEDKLEELTSWLGLHYPAEDIPPHARELYSKNWLRLIADVNYKPVAIVPTINSLTKSPLDLSYAVLRSVSPCHIEYLQNMNVSASMSISIMKEGKLWGLVACHHNSPKYVSYEVRKACEFFGKVMSVELPSKEENKDYEYRIKLKSTNAKLLEYMSREQDFIDGLIKFKPNLLDVVNAQGAAIVFKGNCTLIGKTPTEKAIHKLIHWLDCQDSEILYSTASLPQVYPEAQEYKDIASGLLAVYISKAQSNYVLWFRPEVIQTVQWAGNPNQPWEIGDRETSRLHPRKSFELWKEIVKLTSLPWKNCEINAALELKNAIVSIVLRQAEELATLNEALRESDAREREKAQQLAKALQELQRTQTQLIKQEKMSDLGELVGSIAAEITNPINFISGNLTHAESYAKDLLNLLYLYQQHYPHPEAEIAEELEAMDLEFIIQDLPRMLSSMKVGANRIRDIIQALRNFTRLEESELKPVDIHEGLNSTLLILQHRLKGKTGRRGIEVIKEYGTLPEVECYPGHLNQVFINLLSNAIDALESQRNGDGKVGDRTPKTDEGNSSTPAPTIRIRTEKAEEHQVAICISDNGSGIERDIQSKIFDPFFTTKQNQKGIGVGLAISHQIVVEKHGGTIHCISEAGRGAEFIVKIPLHQGVIYSPSSKG
ncbi:ATP-binding protein [Phormidium sp. CCY1219]|uniref:ATP-binding protein n=1 Tax=Phormidium sp. CCY1219 TaxID=2886104 RepID=UPI002D1EFA9F|nr:ATP-binding protein [Phormidium sp. CCY1219]MEB3826799.1 GAF domain-containing protein [Phormidium sp. CCY1219]